MRPFPGKPSLTQLQLASYSEQQAAAYDAARLSTLAGQYLHEEELRQLQPLFQKIPISARVVEVGCGTGRFLMAAHDWGYYPVGIDSSWPMLIRSVTKFMARRTPPILVQSDARQLPLATGSADLVYAVRLLNQTGSSDNAFRVLSEMIRIVRPGGWICAEFVNWYRPRLGASKGQATVRLRPRKVIGYAAAVGGRLIEIRGAFFLSMQAYHMTPTWLLPSLRTVDRMLSGLLPRSCSRCYVVLRKEGMC